MPEISRFFGIVVVMYYRDHAPPHFHAAYGGNEIRVSIATGRILSGTLSSRAERLVLEWLAMHRDELMENWARAAERLPLRRIDPLD